MVAVQPLLTVNTSPCPYRIVAETCFLSMFAHLGKYCKLPNTNVLLPQEQNILEAQSMLTYVSHVSRLSVFPIRPVDNLVPRAFWPVEARFYVSCKHNKQICFTTRAS